jgi:hypothetical protein
MVMKFFFPLFFQVPVAVGVSSYEAVLLYKGKKVIASKGDQETNWSVKQLVNSILFMWHNCWQGVSDFLEAL